MEEGTTKQSSSPGRVTGTSNAALSVDDLISQTMSLLGPSMAPEQYSSASNANKRNEMVPDNSGTNTVFSGLVAPKPAMRSSSPSSSSSLSSESEGDISDNEEGRKSNCEDGVSVANMALARAAEIVSPASPETVGDSALEVQITKSPIEGSAIQFRDDSSEATQRKETPTETNNQAESPMREMVRTSLSSDRAPGHCVNSPTTFVTSDLSHKRGPDRSDNASGLSRDAVDLKDTASPEKLNDSSVNRAGEETSPFTHGVNTISSGRNSSRFGTKESLRSAEIQKHRANGVRNEMAERARLRMLKKKHEALLLAVEAERQAKKEAEADRLRQKRRKAALRKDRAERQRKLADRHAKAIAEMEMTCTEKGSQNGSSGKSSSERKRQKLTKASQEGDAQGKHLSKAERKAKKKQSRLKRREDAARDAAKEAAKAAEAAAKAASLANMSTKGESSFVFSDVGGSRGNLDELISNYIAVSSSLRAQLHVTQLRIATRMRVKKDNAENPSLIAARDVITTTREHLEAVDRDLPAVHTHLSEMGLLNSVSIGNHAFRTQHNELEHSQSTPLFHSRENSGTASSPWLPRLDNPNRNRGSNVRGSKYTNQHTPLQYSPPRQRGDGRTTQSARGASSLREEHSRPSNVLSGRPSNNRGHDIYVGHGKMSSGRERYAKSQPGASSNGGGRLSSEQKRRKKNSGRYKKGRKKSRRHKGSHHHGRDYASGSEDKPSSDQHHSTDTRTEDNAGIQYEDIDLGSLYANHPSITYIE